MNTKPSIEAKVARLIYNNLTPFVIRAASHPILCKLNLHNNNLLKKINHKAKMVYGMGYQPDILVKASYERGGDDNIENALIAIQDLVRGDNYANHKEFLFERISFLATEGLSAMYEINNARMLRNIQAALKAARERVVTSKKAKSTAPKKVKSVSPKKKVVKPVKRLRNKKGQFITAPSRKKITKRR